MYFQRSKHPTKRNGYRAIIQHWRRRWRRRRRKLGSDGNGSWCIGSNILESSCSRPESLDSRTRYPTIKHKVLVVKKNMIWLLGFVILFNVCLVLWVRTYACSFDMYVYIYLPFGMCNKYIKGLVYDWCEWSVSLIFHNFWFLICVRCLAFRVRFELFLWRWSFKGYKWHRV